MSGKNTKPVLALLALGLAPAIGGADEIAARVVTAGAPGATVFSTQGWAFTPARNLRVSRIGVYDLDGDGLGESHPVGIWTAAGTPVVSVTVPAGTAAAIEGGTRFVEIVPVYLAKNEPYVIGAYYLNSSDGILNDAINGSDLDYDPAVTPGAGRFGANQFSGMAFPGTSSGAPRLGPNFAFTIMADHTWPTDPAPCDDINDLAGCIDAAAPGHIIEIAANAIPAQDLALNVAKGFTLRPALGFTPVFGDYTSLFVPGGDSAMAVVIEGLTFVRGGVRSLGGTGPLDVTIRGNHIQQVFSTGIEVANRSGPTHVVIEDNELVVNDPGEAYGIYLWSLEGTGNTGRIAGNSITQNGGSQGSAIEIANNVGAGSFDVIGNRISGAGFNHGINLYAYGPGNLTARVINNVVHGQVNVSGGPGAISMTAGPGTSSFDVINNTIAFNQIGIRLGGNPDADLTAFIANNVVAFNQHTGMNFETYLEPSIRNEFNLVHGNTQDWYTPGPGTLTANPAFVTPTDLRLQPGSPAENSGSSGRVPAGIVTDVAGGPRIQGIVDRGAFEMVPGGLDSDVDGIADFMDNCKLVANIAQRDSNGDGYGNLCDGDLNNSGLTNVLDYNILRLRLNTDDADADLNGTGLVTVVDFNILRGLLNKPPGPSGLAP